MVYNSKSLSPFHESIKGEHKMTIESVFNLNDKTGGLHNLLKINDVCLDDQGRVTISLNITDQVLNPYGTAHGGIIFALCDTAVGAYFALQKKRPITLDSTIHFYRPGVVGNVLTAVVNKRKAGRTTSVYMVEVHNEQDKSVAEATFTMYHTD